MLLGSQPAPGHIVGGDGDGLEQGGGTQVHARGQPDEGGGRHRPLVLQGAGGVDAHEGQVMTDMSMADPARRALPTPLQRHDAHGITHRPPLDSLAEGSDPTGHLMPNGRRRVDSVVHVPVQDVQVSPADTGVRHRNPDVVRTQGSGVDLDVTDLSGSAIVGCVHR